MILKQFKKLWVRSTVALALPAVLVLFFWLKLDPTPSPGLGDSNRKQLRPTVETHHKTVYVSIRRPVKQTETHTYAYTKLTPVRTQNIFTHPKTGQKIELTKTEHVPVKHSKNVLITKTEFQTQLKKHTYSYDKPRWDWVSF